MFMELKMFKVLILGMQLDVSMVNHQLKKFNQIKTLVNQLNLIVEMLLEKKKTLIEVLDAQQLEKIFLIKILEA